jgi:hypothetical protein
VTNNPYLACIEKSCGDVETHRHVALLGTDAAGKSRARASAPYAQALSQMYAAGLRMSWKENFWPPKMDFVAAA